MDREKSLSIMPALFSWILVLLIHCSAGNAVAGPSLPPDNGRQPQALAPPDKGEPTESMRQAFERWSETESPAAEARVRESSRSAQPTDPAYVLWGRAAPSVAYLRAVADASDRYRRERRELGQSSDPAAPRTLADVGTRFTRAVEAARYTRENVYLLQSLRADTTPRFSVKEIHFSGNTRISSDELLYGLPAVYMDSRKPGDGGRDPNVVYDFRVLCEIIAAPGPPREVSQRTIQGLTKYVLAQYRAAGFAGIYVYVSANAVDGEARLANGVLPIRIIEARVAKVTTKWFDVNDPDGPERQKHVLKDTYVLKHSPVQEGQVVRKERLDEYVRLLNVNPDRYVRATASPAEEPNALNVTYDVFERSPWHFYTQLDNSGTDTRQWNPRVGLLNTNLTGHDDFLSMMYQVDVEALEDNYAVFGRYEFPLLGPRFRMGFFGGVSEFNITPESTGGLLSFLGDGVFGGATFRYNVAQFEDWMVDLTSSLSWEESRIDRSLGIDSDVDMALVGLGFEVHRLRERSGTSVGLERLENYEGDLDEFQNARFGSDPDFIRYSFGAAHWQFIDQNKRHQISTRFRHISSTERLVPAKMTTFGGLYTVRGYEEDEIVADGGILASLEYRFYVTKCLFPLEEAKSTQSQDRKDRRSAPLDVSLVAFTDYGRPEIKDPQEGEFGAQDMWGIGLGTIIECKKNLWAAIYHSWALRETIRPSDGSILTGEGDTQWNFNFILRF
ncbi:MAG: hypothetical protein A2Y76_09875 [Planctomycetes bacterium RBG_13_60_9]|nr:MAG: hypothetical protein A2Y76_09875 [Planctomycetes bacterium RBG_13_60_9]